MPFTDLLSSELLPELELIRPLGSGSTADVYLARDPALQRLVAVKVLRPELAVDAVARKRFEREALSAARITHPHVTSIHRVGRLSNQVPYMVMEYVDGRSVRDLLETRGPFESAEARAILTSVASALAAAHESGIVHRDVRPDNVLVENRTGRAVLSDFGIAALLETGSGAATRLTATGVRVGDPSHMSPEQIRREPVTAQSDVYAFGILAYEMLAGRPPYDAATPADMLLAHVGQAPRRLQELCADADVTLAAVVERCLAKEPQRRPHARDVAAILARTAPSPRAQEAAVSAGPLAQFLEELRRRRVYRVLAGYTAFAIAVLGGAQTIFDAFDLPHWSYRMTVAVTLGGLPLAAILAWVYDLTDAGVRRTRANPAGTVAWAGLKWLGLGASVLTAGLVAWMLLRGR